MMSTQSPASLPEQSLCSAQSETSNLQALTLAAQQVITEQPFPSVCRLHHQLPEQGCYALEHLLPSKAGASGEAWGPGSRRLTVRSLSVPPRGFSIQVYTVEPGIRGRLQVHAGPGVHEPLGGT